MSRIGLEDRQEERGGQENGRQGQEAAHQRLQPLRESGLIDVAQRDQGQKQEHSGVGAAATAPGSQVRDLIVGAGQAGASLDGIGKFS